MDVIIEQILAPLGIWPEGMEEHLDAMEAQGFDVRLDWQEEFQRYEVTLTRPIRKEAESHGS